MSRCWLDGELRAWLDRELPPPDMEAIGRHLTECRQCSALSAELSARAARVSALLGALDHVPAVLIAARSRAPRRIVAAALVLAAASLLLFAWIHKPKPIPVTPAILSPASVPPVALPSKPATMPKRRVARRNDMHYYLALDDEPIESGVVLRVTLPDSGQLADVIFDEQGRPRAVRPLN